MRTIGKLVGIVTLLWTITAGTNAHASVTPSTQWINFYSPSSTMDDTPLPVGSVVRAYDMEGNQCGEFVVHAPGTYGFLACYLDDPNTAVDEGIGPGEVVRFTVDDREAGTVSVPTSIYNGFRIRFDIAIGLVVQSCIDGYEEDNSKTTANSLTGPEAHTFYSQKRGWDQDWSKFTAKANWIYQIRARSNQPFGITHPLMRVYDENGRLLAENDMDKWGHGAEVWWWNSGVQATVYIQMTEKDGQYGCRHYTLTLVPWNPDEFALRFGPR